jgi:adhesin/invasin
MLTFDGQGNVSASWTEAADTSTSAVTASGTYSVAPDCHGTASFADASNNKSAWSLAIYNAAAGNVLLAVSKPQSMFLGIARAAFENPGQRVVNAASYATGATPPGSVFALFGLGLSATQGQPTTIPLPGTFQNTTVTVNGEPAPLFYVSPIQINAQMPEDIKPGLATVIVKNGSSTSNAVAVEIPSAATPGLIYYGDNRAVVVDASKNNVVNTTSAPAQVGDFLVAYFTGGGPVNASGPVVTGAGSPAGLSPVAATTRITVAGVDAVTQYVGLTPGSIGLYQANFQLPRVAAGDRQLVITIGGKASNSALIAVGN